MAEGMFVRVYHEDLIANYPAIWDDDRALSTWLRLLAMADKLWPSPAELPRSVRKATLTLLTDAGLITVLPKNRYSVRGLDPDRSKRRTAAQDAAAARWGNAEGNAESNASAYAEAMPHTRMTRSAQSASASVSVSEKGGEGAGEGDDEPEFRARQWLAIHGCYIAPGNGFHRQLVTAVERHGVNALVEMFDRLREAGVIDGDVKGFVFGAIDALKPKPDLRALEAEEDAEAARKRRRIADQRSAANLAYLRGEFPSYADALDAMRRPS